MRWQHPDRGLLGAGRRSSRSPRRRGLIDELGRWVLDEACAQAQRVAASSTRDDAPLSVSVNLSPRQLRDPRLVDDVARAARPRRAAAGVASSSRSPRAR